MKISVVIATFNGEKYIEEQLLSIINQTYLPYEIIISDDNSSDHTLDIISNIKNSLSRNIKIKILKSSINQ